MEISGKSTFNYFKIYVLVGLEGGITTNTNPEHEVNSLMSGYSVYRDTVFVIPFLDKALCV